MKMNYARNPYVYGMVNVFVSFCRDYADAQKALERNPEDIRGVMVRDYCFAFADWLSAATGLDRKGIGEMLLKMMEDGTDDK